MNKLIITTLIGVVLSGCSYFSSGEPSEAELKSQYNMLLATFLDNVRVDKVDNVKCNQTGYAFPSEKVGPIYECQALVHFIGGKSVEDKLSFYRRPEGFNGDIDMRDSYVIEGLRQLEDEKQNAMESKRLEDMALEEQEHAKQRMDEEAQNSENQEVPEEHIEGGE